MGAFCNTSKENTVQFSASFSTDLKALYQKYKRIVFYLRQSKLFASEQHLQPLVHTYLTDPISLDKDYDTLLAIDSSHKLHPLQYGSNQKVTLQWLTQACLRQNKFIMQLPVQMLSYQTCYKHYVQFLYLCFKRPKEVIIPNKMADFMWHSHMLDNQGYKNDIQNMLKRVLNHKDDYDEEELNQYSKKTQEIREILLPVRKGKLMSKNGGNGKTSTSTHYGGYSYIHYGNGVCEGAFDPFEPHKQQRNDNDYRHKEPIHHSTNSDKDKSQKQHGTIDIHHNHHHSDGNNYHQHKQVDHHDIGGHHDVGGNGGCGGGGDGGCGGGCAAD